MNELLADLQWRGLIHQSTGLEKLGEHLSTSRSVYAGFDPTSDSLTIGNLVPILMLKRFQLAGHRPVVVMGGGTGLIGDPSGKETERQLRTQEEISDNVAAISRIFSRLLQADGPSPMLILNNLDWIGQLSYVEALRDLGKHFSVNMMIQKESVRERLNNREQGISYTEFSYMLLQAYDFKCLFEREGVTVQLGGSDQWGNIVAGVDLVRRTHQAEAYGLTTPLVTKTDGGKFGKTESGAIWLTAPRTSAYAFYQFWLNAADTDLDSFLKIFGFLSRSETEQLLQEHAADPGARKGQRALAAALTLLLHGEQALHDAEQASAALFSGQVSALNLPLLEEVFEHVPSSAHQKQELSAGANIVDVLASTSLAKSKREARQFLDSGAISLNGEKVASDRKLGPEDLLHDSLILLRRGKKHWHVTKWL